MCFWKTKRILIVAAHPDDEILGCGATIAKHVAGGGRVWVLILGEGITSRRKLSPADKRKSLAKLHSDAKRASEIIGAEHLILNKFPDNQFDSLPLLHIVHAIEEVIEDFKPDLIYTHDLSDVNIDHRLTVQALEAAARPLPQSGIEAMLSFEVPSSTEWNITRERIFRPNVFVSLEKHFLEKKIQALRCYRSEVRPFPHPRSPEYLGALAAVRGAQAGHPLAEAFQLLRWRVR